MQSPRIRVLLTGTITSWGKQFLAGLESNKLIEVAYEPNVEKIGSLESVQGYHTVILENMPESHRWITQLRASGKPFFIIWFGRSFTKDDFVFGELKRVYAMWEDLRVEDSRVFETLTELEQSIESLRHFDQVVRGMKAMAIQTEGEEGANPLIQEMKTALTKLEQLGHRNEFFGREVVTTDSETSKLPFRISQSFADALDTVHELERTGMLRVRGKETGQEGRIEFLQGKIISANCGEVHGLKAIYRMFLWDEPRFLFARRNPEEAVVEEGIDISMKTLCSYGESMRQRYSKIRREIPPLSLKLNLDVGSVHTGTTLAPNDFSTLSSVVECQKVGHVLNYNPLPDVDIYQALIELKRAQLIRVA